MAATKMRSKKPTKGKKTTAKKAAPARKNAMNARANTKKVAAKKKLPVRKDQTTVRNGPHHLDRHPTEGGIHVHPAPMVNTPAVRPTVVIRHH